MRPHKWDPNQFIDRFSKLPSSPAAHRAYQSAQEFLRNDERKLLRELEVFVSFCQRLGLDVRPADVVTLDPNSSHPPPPDVECQLPGGSHFFELAEIIQEDIAEASSLRNERAISKPRDPLARVWETLRETLAKKLRKTYNPEARPRSLLLYYDRSDSFWEFLRPVVNEKATEIRNIFLDAGTFDQVFLFDVRQRNVLLYFSTESFKVCD